MAYVVHGVIKSQTLSDFHFHFSLSQYQMGFPGGSDGKESACNAGNPGLILGSGRCPGEVNGHPLHYSCLENPKDKGAWWPIVHGIAKSQSQLKRLSLPTLLSEAHAFNSCAISIVQVLAWSTCEDWSRIAVS